MLLLRMISLFSFWALYGDGESSSHHPVSEFVFEYLCLITPIALSSFLIYRSLMVNDFARVKSFMIIIVISTLFFIKYNDAFLS